MRDMLTVFVNIYFLFVWTLHALVCSLEKMSNECDVIHSKEMWKWSFCCLCDNMYADGTVVAGNVLIRLKMNTRHERKQHRWYQVLSPRQKTGLANEVGLSEFWPSFTIPVYLFWVFLMLRFHIHFQSFWPFVKPYDERAIQINVAIYLAFGASSVSKSWCYSICILWNEKSHSVQKEKETWIYINQEDPFVFIRSCLLSLWPRQNKLLEKS